MAQTRTYIVYEFKELTEESQEKAIERIAQGNHEFFDSDILTETFKERLAEWGFPTDKIEWSLGHSQGDGVAFYGSIDVNQYLTKTKQRTKYRILIGKDPQATIHRNSFGYHYSHYNTMDVDDDTYNLWQTPKALNLMADLIENIQENIKALSRELEKLGYEEIDRVTSKEYILEQIEDNEWVFTEDGRID